MKTFDLAIFHLSESKSKFDYLKNDECPKEINDINIRFLADENNKESNDHYKNMIFTIFPKRKP
jgi:hypothetical protein